MTTGTFPVRILSQSGLTEVIVDVIGGVIGENWGPYLCVLVWIADDLPVHWPVLKYPLPVSLFGSFSRTRFAELTGVPVLGEGEEQVHLGLESQDALRGLDDGEE